ncbi:Golgi to ER traffic protein 4 [Vanrija pseudolonga]|uniref:Golgi to ER traffic protein 4 n=1 Tax=Vanrija pseudolonga TaxID=143232 RepID=A0AAF0Y7J3_9TREE|nr:Golgi to ER traffic protein 4 [Vanrija pseudolonga]
MPPRTARTPTLEALLPPILANLQSDPPNAYSAHQKALTTTARLVHAGHGALAVEILFAVARELLKLGEAGSGVELGVRMIEIMGQIGTPVDDKSKASVTQLLALTPPSGNWRKKLADAAVKWSAAGGCPTGDPSLHQYLGELYYKDRLFVPAEHHLLASGKRDAATLLAELLFEWSEKGKQDPGPYAVKGTLPFLAQSPPNVLPAAAFLQRFLSLLQSPASAASSIFLGSAPGPTPTDAYVELTTSPTLNFLQLALATVERAPAPGVSGVQARGTDGGVARDWQQLLARYRRIAGSDGVLANPDVNEALEHISASVFLIPQRNTGQNDLLQNLMGSLFGGGSGGGLPGLGAR